MKTLRSKLIVLSIFLLIAVSASESNAQNTNYGTGSFSSNTIGYGNSAFGDSSLKYNAGGDENSAFGIQSLYLNTQGIGNSAVGYSSLFYNTLGNGNSAVGSFSLYSNTTGSFNSALGIQSLYSNTTGGFNSAFGDYSLSSDTSGGNNSAFGYYSLAYNTNGTENCAFGDFSLDENTTGSGNVAVGKLALAANITGSHNTAIGNNADANADGYSNSSCFGNGSTITASEQVRIGSSSIKSIGGVVDWTKVSDGRFKTNVKENVVGLAFINKLRPVTYNLDVAGLNNYLNPNAKQAVAENQKQAKNQTTESGFIAQEVEEVAKETGYNFSGVDAPKNNKDIYGLRYGDFVVPLVKSIQELSSENDKLKDEVNQLKAAVYGSSDMNSGTARIAINAAANTPLLGQNIPNPAANNTIIPFRIPKNCNSASIVISEVGSGKIITAIAVSCDETNIALDAGSIASGSYMYSLYVDGSVVETKQMVLTK